MSELVSKAFKVTEDTQKALESIQKTFKSEGIDADGMMKRLISLYEIESAKKDLPDIKLELEALQGLTNKIFDTYFNLGRNIDTMLKGKEAEYSKTIELKDRLVNSLNEDKLALSEQNAMQGQEIKEINSIMKKLQEELAEANKTIERQDKNSALLEDKAKSLSDLVASYQEHEKDYQANKDLLDRTLREADNMKLILKEKDTEIERMKADKTALETQHANRLAEINNAHTSEIERLQATAELEKGKAILEADKKHQKELEELREKFNRKIEDLGDKYDKARETIDQLKEDNRNLSEAIAVLHQRAEGKQEE